MITVHVKKDHEMAQWLTLRHGVQHPICEDDTGATSAAYGVRAVPTFVLIRKDGTVASTSHGLPSEDTVEGLLAR